jgi:hypothetical protein
MKTTILVAALLALSLTVPVPASADLSDAVRSLPDFNRLYDSVVHMAQTQNVTPSSYCESGGCEASVSVDVGEGHVVQISKITGAEAADSRLICFRNLGRAERQTCVNDRGRINVDKLTPDGEAHLEKLLRLGWPNQ